MQQELITELEHTNWLVFRGCFANWLVFFLPFFASNCQIEQAKSFPKHLEINPADIATLKENQTSDSIITVKVTPSSDQFGIDHFIEVDSLIFLSNEYPLGYIEKVIQRGPLLYLLDNSASKLYCFNTEGQYQWQFGDKGNNEKQIKGLDDFALLLHKDELILLDHKGMSITHINATNGQFLQKKTINLFAHEIASLDSNTYLIFADFSIWDPAINGNLITLNSSLKILTNDFPISEKSAEIAFSKVRSLNAFNPNSILFNPLLNDTIFSIGVHQGIVPKYAIDFGKIALNQDLYNAKELRNKLIECRKEATRIDNIIELDNGLFFTFCYQDGYYCFYDKILHKVHTIATENLEENIFLGGMNLKPMGINEKGTQFIFTVDPFMIADQYQFIIQHNPNIGEVEKWLSKFPLFQKIRKQTTIDDNPVLVFASFKSSSK